MEDVDNDVVMDSEDQDMLDASVTNGFIDGVIFGNGSAAGSQDGNSSEEELDDESYPISFQRRGQLATGCCYDDRMKLHANADFGPNPHHPEDPSRIEEIMKTFKKAGLVYSGSVADLAQIVRDNPTKYMWRIAAREARREEIELVHHAKHYFWVKELANKSTHELRKLTRILDQGRDSLYVGSMTFEASLISAGGAIETCKAVVRGDVKNAIAVIRPPGHHAEFDAPMGFCLFNNVPIAAAVCMNEYPDLCKKILILDWDVHHGNGIQNMFYDKPNVLYISIHVYQNGTFYPGQPDNPMLPDGGIDKCGRDAGLGRNINIGWHDQGMGDGEYMAAFQKIIMPIGQEFNPDLVIISAGFDAAAGDELGGCFVTPTCFAHMTHMLMSLADGKVAACLEGGYNLNSISQSALAVARTLMGEPPPKLELPKINKDAAILLGRVQAHQAPYWECMRPGVVDVRDMQDQGGQRLHEVIRAYQREMLGKKYGMYPLFVQREAVFKSFHDQVLVTPSLESARKILMVIHDPPEIMAQPSPLDGTVELHNAWLNDGVTRYTDWAISHGFGVIDVNVPRVVLESDATDSFTPGTTEKALQDQLQDLMCYIWDNYLQISEAAEEIFVMGVGTSYLGVKVLLLNRDCKLRISGIVNFVSGSLRAVKSDVDPDLASWYRDNSRIYVIHDHACWADPDLTRKVTRRRFGTVIRSPTVGLNKMMAEHAAETQEWIMGRVADGGHGDTTEEDKAV